jgi:acetate kinase
MGLARWDRTMSLLVLNVGSSNLKFALFDDAVLAVFAEGMVELGVGRKTASLTLASPSGFVANRRLERDDVCNYGDAANWLIDEFGRSLPQQPIAAVGHRIVHGGTEFHEPVIIDDAVIASLRRLSWLAPVHNPPAIRAINAARERLLGVPQVAVFDTSFYAKLPRRATTYPIPHHWQTAFGIRRFGFHGISHQYCSIRAAEMLGRDGDPALRTVICHLGSGCSVTAIQGADPIATSMGFTPMEGLMMGTRCGSIDPGIVLHMIEHENFTAAELRRELNERSGLLGVSGVSADYRLVEASALQGNQNAQLALEMFSDRVRAMIGSMAVSLGGLDALVFTGGIGKHSANLRTQVCHGLSCLGLEICEDRNQSATADCDISANHSLGRLLVVHTREEQWIGQQTVRVGL